MPKYRVIESNEALATMRYVGGDFDSLTGARVFASYRFGDPARKRSYAVMLVESPDRSRLEVVRGTAR